jgi:hypothetical protein
LDEYGNIISFRKEVITAQSYGQFSKAQLIDYPNDIPYERGKVVKYGKKYYDLETYEKISNKVKSSK